jgi:TATA-binding protein-associated factor Taf7
MSIFRMAKTRTSPLKTRAPTKAARAPAPNPRLGAQTRKILTQHYRAKHGVR